MSELADRLRAEAEHQESEYDLVVDTDLLRAAADELDRLHAHLSAGILHRTEPVSCDPVLGKEPTAIDVRTRAFWGFHV